MSGRKNPRIYLSKTPTEWKLIDDKIKALGRAGLKSYLRGKVSLLVKDYVVSRNKVCEAIERREKREEYIPACDLEILSLIAKETKIPIATIVAQLILDPLIRESKP